ncbi:hypothetical protein M5K25_014354 [Dendrobium thyrsiflorum]|uniref:Reverse transcriptase zinc-binding domain-containing protein n=1 Tax=Dendrobium thyrsiflorum TaxID=117978 RepID=A0ABD0UVX4_DENTH
MLCLLENRILPSNLNDPWFCSSHRIFENEDSFHNFDCATPGKIWLKWDSNKISFSPSFSSSQLNSCVISSNTFLPFHLSVVYASNSFSERFNLWHDLCSLDPKDFMPWVIMGDVNCCRFQSDKAGGNVIPNSKLAPFNNFIFEANLSEIPSSGNFHTWYNQRTDNPILIRLDRMLPNDSWFTAFPSSSYKVRNSLISDHSPLILKDNTPLQRFPRFLYKNYWSNLSDFWNVLLEVFDGPIVGNPIIWLYKSLKMLNSDLDFYLSTWTSWTIQRGKVQFIRYTITNTIAYWLRGALIPKTIIKIIGKNCSKFLYFSGHQGKSLHLISWSNTCKPVSKGGLGIASLQALRFAVNCDIISRFYNLSSLLSIWLRARYISPWRPCSNPDSALWKSICSTAYSFKHNFSFSINADSPASIVWDHWCSGTQLSSILPDISISNWNAPSSLGGNLANFLSSVPISSAQIPHVIWKDQLHPKDLDVEWHHYMWHKKKCLRYSVFTWLAFKGGLKTVDILARRNISVPDPVCPLCRSDLESLNHIFFDCNYSFSVITRFLPSFQSFYLRPSLFQAFQHVRNLHEAKVVECGLLLTLNAIIYHLWRERNNRRFNSSSLCTVSIAKVISKAIKFKLSSWKHKEYLLEKFQFL